MLAVHQIKTTKKADKILKQVDDFIQAYKQAKKRAPDVVHLTQKQLDDLGVESGYLYKGIELQRQ